MGWQRAEWGGGGGDQRYEPEYTIYIDTAEKASRMLQYLLRCLMSNIMSKRLTLHVGDKSIRVHVHSLHSH